MRRVGRRAPTRHGTRSSRLVLAGCALIVVGTVLVSAVVLARRLVDPGLHLDALDRADAFDRVYTEVLADPELAAVTDDLAGGLRPALTTQARALATASLRLTLPPATLRSATESGVGAVLAYVRGDTDTLEVDVGVEAVIDRLTTTRWPTPGPSWRWPSTRWRRRSRAIAAR